MSIVRKAKNKHKNKHQMFCGFTGKIKKMIQVQENMDKSLYNLCGM